MQHQRVETEQEREACADRGRHCNPEVRGVDFNEAAERNQKRKHNHDQNEDGDDGPFRHLAATARVVLLFARTSFTFQVRSGTCIVGAQRDETTTGALLVRSQHFFIHILFEIEFAWHFFSREFFFLGFGFFLNKDGESFFFVYGLCFITTKKYTWL